MTSEQSKVKQGLEKLIEAKKLLPGLKLDMKNLEAMCGDVSEVSVLDKSTNATKGANSLSFLLNFVKKLK